MIEISEQRIFAKSMDEHWLIYIRLLHTISRYSIENVRYIAAIDIIRRINKSVATAITRRGESLNRESHQHDVCKCIALEFERRACRIGGREKERDNRKADANYIRSGDLLSSLVAELQSLANRYCEYCADTARKYS